METYKSYQEWIMPVIVLAQIEAVVHKKPLHVQDVNGGKKTSKHEVYKLFNKTVKNNI